MLRRPVTTTALLLMLRDGQWVQSISVSHETARHWRVQSAGPIWPAPNQDLVLADLYLSDAVS